MLNTTLVFSALLLLTANAGIYHRGMRAIAVLICIVGMLIGLFGPLTLVGLLSVVLVHLLMAGEFCSRRWWRFPAFSGLAATVAFLLTAFAMPEQRRLTTLREEFPFEPVGEQLPAPAPTEQVATESSARLEVLERSMDERWWRSRSTKLRRLHETKVEGFVATPGFGVGRVSGLPIRDLNEGLRPEDQRVRQPNGGSARTHDDTTSDIRIREGSLLDLHGAGLLDFINHENFGYVKDRRHVAGFQSHRFSKVPEPAEGWRVEMLDLIGLLLHEKPVAYVSADLPRMDELRKAPTRPLDRFESAALEKLRRGEDLAVADTAIGLRMLGAIRNAKQCIECHDGKRGDLLGAFSYTLRAR